MGIRLAKRPQARQIEEAALNAVRVATPADWQFEETGKDFGRDGYLEVFDGDESTGRVIPCQVKGQQRATRVHDGHKIAQRISVGRLRYLVELEGPSVLLVADTSTKEVWWLTPQTSAEVQGILAQQSPDKKEVTIHVPTTNVYGEKCRTDFLTGIGKASQWVATNVLCAGDLRDYTDAISVGLDLEEVERALQDRTDLLRLRRAIGFAVSGNLEAAAEALAVVFQNPQSAAPMKVAALVQQEAVATQAAVLDRRPNFELRTTSLYIARAILDLCRPESLSLRFFAHANRRAAELHFYCNEAFEQAMVRLTPDSLLKPFILEEIRRRERYVTRAINRNVRLFNRLIAIGLEKKLYTQIPELVAKFLYAIQNLALALAAEKRAQARERIMEISKPLADMGMQIAQALGDGESVLTIGTMLVGQHPGEDAPALKNWCNYVTERVTVFAPKEQRDHVLEQLRLRIEDLMLKVHAGADYNEEIHRQIVTNLASQLGINLDDEDDRIADIVRVGLKDYSPERVIRECEHMFMMARDYGEIGQMLDLPTAGQKELWCTKHGHAMGGWDLDDLAGWFKEEYCRKCGDHVPRAEAWRWSRNWQIDEIRKHIDSGAISKKSLIERMIDQQEARYAPRQAKPSDEE